VVDASTATPPTTGPSARRGDRPAPNRPADRDERVDRGLVGHAEHPLELAFCEQVPGRDVRGQPERSGREQQVLHTGVAVGSSQHGSQARSGRPTQEPLRMTTPSGPRPCGHAGYRLQLAARRPTCTDAQLRSMGGVLRACACRRSAGLGARSHLGASEAGRRGEGCVRPVNGEPGRTHRPGAARSGPQAEWGDEALDHSGLLRGGNSRDRSGRTPWVDFRTLCGS
jgi:hypothetical protein